MSALPYPTASYPNDPLEIPIDTMTSIEMEVYYPGLVQHQADSGAPFSLQRGLPRWRGNVRWAACYTNSERAGAIEGYLSSMTEGIYTSTLKHGRGVPDARYIYKRGDGIGKAAIAYTRAQGPTLYGMAADKTDSMYRAWVFPGIATTIPVGESFRRVYFQAEMWSGTTTSIGQLLAVSSPMVTTTTFTVPFSFRSTAEGFYISGALNTFWIRIRSLDFHGLQPNPEGTGATISEWGPYYRQNLSFHRFNPTPDFGPSRGIRFDRGFESGTGFMTGKVFKMTTNNRIFMLTSVDGNNLTFAPEMNIFGVNQRVELDRTPSNQFLTVRATPGRTISLPRNRTLSGPWNMSWIEGV